MKLQTEHYIANGYILIVKSLFNLTIKDLAKILNSKETTVRSWLIRPQTRNYNRAPDSAARKLLSLYSIEVI